VASFQRALELRPDYAAAHYNLGYTLLRLGRVEEARGHFAAAVKAAPDFEAAREMLERLR
jgi:Flp pilus assembly protein TadD